MPEFDPRYVDVDFTKERQFTFGMRPPTKKLMSMQRYSDVYASLPESQWQPETEIIEAEGGGNERLITRIFNQSNEGSCVGNAGTQGHQICQAKQFGKENVVQLSAISLYKQIGSSPNSGAMCEDALTESARVGILPLDTPENRERFGAHVMPHTGFRTPYPSGWEATAKRFRVDKTLEIRSLAEIVTAGINQHPIIVGRSGHSIIYCRPTYKNGGLSFIYVNSWGQWGFGAGDFEYGFGLDSQRMVNSSAGWAYAVVSVTDWRVAA